MDNTNILNILNNTTLTKNDYNKIINLCEGKIKNIFLDNVKKFIDYIIKDNLIYSYKNEKEHNNFIKFINNITIMKCNVYKDYEFCYSEILFEYNRTKIKIFTKEKIHILSENTEYLLVMNNFVSNFNEQIIKIINAYNLKISYELLNIFFY